MHYFPICFANLTGPKFTKFVHTNTIGHTPHINDGFLRWCVLHWGILLLLIDKFYGDELYWNLVFLLMMDYWDDSLHWDIAISPFHLSYDELGVIEWPYTRAEPFQKALLLEMHLVYLIFYIGTYFSHWSMIFEVMVYFKAQLLHRFCMVYIAFIPLWWSMMDLELLRLHWDIPIFSIRSWDWFWYDDIYRDIIFIDDRMWCTWGRRHFR